MKIYKLSKNLLFIGFFLLLSIILTPNYFLLNCDNIYADNKLQYAKIVGSNVKLYRTTSGSEDISNIFFTIPKSYYVLLRPCDNDDYYSATYIDEADFDIKQTTANVAIESEFSALPSITQIIIIVAVSLPCLFIIYLLFKPTKITSRMIENAELKSKKKPRKIKRKDYYEYQE